MGGDVDRAVSELVGFIIVFAIIIIVMGAIQATLVPQQNHAVEFDHNQRVHADMQSVRGAIIGTADSTSLRPVRIELGTVYPSRLVFIDPAPPTGTLETVGTESESITVTIANASAAGNAGDYWDGSDRRYATGALIYRPGYNQYQNAPHTVYENSVVYNRFEETTIPLSSQSVIDGRTITLVMLDGNLSATSTGTHSLDVRTVSAASNTIALSDTGGNLTVSLPTRLPESAWMTLLDGEFTTNGSGGHVLDIRVDSIAESEFDRLTIELEPGITYDLRLAKVGVGTGVTAPRTAYVVDGAGNNTAIVVGDEQQLTADVRDQFNNPKSGTNVTFTTDDGAFGDGGTEAVVTTDENGRASVTFTSPTAGEAMVTAGIDRDDDGSLEDEPANLTVSFHLDVGYAGVGRPYTVNDPTDVTVSETAITGGQGNDPTYLNVTLENVDSTTHTIEKIRVGFYHSAQAERPANWTVTTYLTDPYEIAGPYVPLDPSLTFAPGEAHELEIEFLTAAGDNYPIESSHHLVISVLLEDGAVRTYVIQPETSA